MYHTRYDLLPLVRYPFWPRKIPKASLWIAAQGGKPGQQPGLIRVLAGPFCPRQLCAAVSGGEISVPDVTGTKAYHGRPENLLEDSHVGKDVYRPAPHVHRHHPRHRIRASGRGHGVGVLDERVPHGNK